MDQSVPPEKVAQPIGYSSRYSGSVEEETGMPVSPASPQRQINRQRLAANYSSSSMKSSTPRNFFTRLSRNFDF